MTGDLPTRSPWLEQLRKNVPAQPLSGDHTTDVVVVGGGIAGASTAFFLAHETDQRVLLVERGRTGHGATGHNAGQLATYFERSLQDLVEEYGFDLAIEAQRGLDGAWNLLDRMIATIDASIPIDRFTGNMGMFSLNHVTVHLRHSALRRRGGLAVPECKVADDAPFLADIPTEFAGLYSVVPRAVIQAALGPGTDRYCAVLRGPTGAANGALLVEHAIGHLQRAHADRFQYADETLVEEVVLYHDHVEVIANGHTVTAGRVVMCTNGFVDHSIHNAAGDPIGATMHHHLIGTKGYMTGVVEPLPSEPIAYSFIRNEHIGDDELPYIYVTHRPWDDGMLVVFGGPEEELADATTYDAAAGFPTHVIAEFENDVLPLAAPDHVARAPFDFRWHGLMAYTTNKMRIIGTEPRNPLLLYNLGCNGVGFMPSIFGGHRIARMLAGDDLGPSIFDPPDVTSPG